MSIHYGDYIGDRLYTIFFFFFVICFFLQAEDGIRDLVRSRGLGDVYKRQDLHHLGQSDCGVQMLSIG